MPRTHNCSVDSAIPSRPAHQPCHSPVLAREVRARGRSRSTTCSRARDRRLLGRRAELRGAQSPASDEEGRPRLLLPLQREAVGDRRHRRGRARGVSRTSGVRRQATRTTIRRASRDEPTWFMVDLRGIEPLPRPVSLDEIKKTEGLAYDGARPARPAVGSAGHAQGMGRSEAGVDQEGWRAATPVLTPTVLHRGSAWPAGTGWTAAT